MQFYKIIRSMIILKTIHVESSFCLFENRNTFSKFSRKIFAWNDTREILVTKYVSLCIASDYRAPNSSWENKLKKLFGIYLLDAKFGDIFARYSVSKHVCRPILERLLNFVKNRERIGPISFRDNLIIEAFGNVASCALWHVTMTSFVIIPCDK